MAKEERRPRKEEKPNTEDWKPRTSLGLKVKNGEITDLSQIFDNGLKILESEIVDVLLPNLENELLLIGQAKGKFGGGQRRIFRQTQKKTKEGNKPKFSTCAVVGNKNGYVGLGFGKSKETVPAREKSIRQAKLNMFKIRRGCGSWESNARDPNSIPYTVEGKCGSVQVKLIPAPAGTGLRIEKECAKILHLAGIQDCWSETRGHTKTKINLLKACVSALQKLVSTKTRHQDHEGLGIVDGMIIKEVAE